MDWCKKHGVISSKVKFPAFFAEGNTGIQALETIRHRETVFSVPIRLIFAQQKALFDPVLR